MVVLGQDPKAVSPDKALKATCLLNSTLFIEFQFRLWKMADPHTTEEISLQRYLLLNCQVQSLTDLTTWSIWLHCLLAHSLSQII